MLCNGNLDIGFDILNGFFVCFWKFLYFFGFLKYIFEDLFKMWFY